MMERVNSEGIKTENILNISSYLNYCVKSKFEGKKKKN
jgi:hypothetical protein